MSETATKSPPWIRFGTPEDYDKVLALDALVWEHDDLVLPAARPLRARDFNRKRVHTLVSVNYEDGLIDSYLIYRTRTLEKAGKVTLCRLMVRPERRRQGLGTHLGRWWLCHLRGRFAELARPFAVHASVPELNLQAQHFLAKLFADEKPAVEWLPPTGKRGPCVRFFAMP